jgi:hypothetical protein
MNDAHSIVSRLRDLIREVGYLDRPSVGLLEPEIRSGDKFLLRDPFAGKADTAGAGTKARERIKPNRAVGAIVVEWGYDVPSEKINDFLDFLNDNELTLLDPANWPPGVRYRGTYSVFSTSEKNSGQFRTIWTYKEFGDLDLLSDQYEDGTTLASLTKKLRSFADDRPGAARSQQIYLLASSSRLTDR